MVSWEAIPGRGVHVGEMTVAKGAEFGGRLGRIHTPVAAEVKGRAEEKM